MRESLLLKLLILLSSLLVVACSSTEESGGVLADRTVDYKRERQADQGLEIPPDLSRSSIKDTLAIPEIGSEKATTYSEYLAERRGYSGGKVVGGDSVLPEMDNITVQRDGNQRWLEIQAPPQVVWPKVLDFWRENGVLLEEEDPTIGLMKTSWLENRADIKQGAITEFLRKALPGAYTSATRDQFRVRLEPGNADGTTLLYLTHRGMEEEYVLNASGQPDGTFWTPRPNDPGLEAAMLRKLMVFLGVSEERAAARLAQGQAEPGRKSELKKAADGSTSLTINEGFERAWRWTGIALERGGFAVEDRDRSQGIYYVRYDDPLKEREAKGFLSKLAFWKDDEIDNKTQFQVKLEGMENHTLVEVRNEQGVRDTSPTATRILTLLQEQIR